MKLNAQFRNWTRGVSFTLNMGKTQVATLVAIHASQDQTSHIGLRHKALRCWVTACDGLQERGLVIHHDWDVKTKGRMTGKEHFRTFWEITTAGLHVVALLKEAGVYQELEAEFRAHDAGEAAARKARLRVG